MAVFNLFSKRQKKLREENTDIFSYDSIPEKFRIQTIHIIKDAIGLTSKAASHTYNSIHNTLCREYGVFTLVNRSHSHEDSIFNYLLNTDNYEHVLDIIELCFNVINGFVRNNIYQFHDRKILPDDAIDELNIRFKENSIGYQFTSDELIRIDSTFIHSEVTKPTLLLLSNNIFKGANDEFLKAHEHYRHGRNKECLNECLKSFESVLKTICKKQKWKYNPTDTSNRLIDICLTNGLIPPYLQNQYTSLRSLFESGISTLRNRLGGHGQGSTTIVVDDHIAGYALHLTASNIKFLIEAEKLLK